MFKNFIMICLTCKEKGAVSVAIDLEKKQLKVVCGNCSKVELHQLEKVGLS